MALQCPAASPRASRSMLPLLIGACTAAACGAAAFTSVRSVSVPLRRAEHLARGLPVPGQQLAPLAVQDAGPALASGATAPSLPTAASAGCACSILGIVTVLGVGRFKKRKQRPFSQPERRRWRRMT